MNVPLNRGKQSQTLVFIWLVLLTLLVIGFLITQSMKPVTTPPHLQVQQLELVDAQGQIIARLGTQNDRTGLFLLDENGRHRVSLFRSDDTDGLYIDDNSGHTRIGIAQFSHGGGGVALHGAESKGAAVLYLKESGSLRMFDRAGNVTHRFPALVPE